MGNVLSTDAYPLFSWHPLLLWAKLALFTAYTHSVASVYFALDEVQLLRLYHAHCALHIETEIQRPITAWANLVSEALNELHYKNFWREVERLPDLTNEALNEVGLSGCILAHRSRLSFTLSD